MLQIYHFKEQEKTEGKWREQAVIYVPHLTSLAALS